MSDALDGSKTLAGRALATVGDALRSRRAPSTELGGTQLRAIEAGGWEVAGLVAGAAVGHLGAVARPAGNAEVEVLSAAMHDARRRALATLTERAAELGAAGVLDVRIDRHPLADQPHLLRFTMEGTALRQAAGTAPGPPWVTTANALDLVALAADGWQPAGLAMGVCVYHVGRQDPRRWAAGQIANREMAGYTLALYEARELAMLRLQADAVAQGADGVVGVTFTERSHVWGRHVIEMAALGSTIRAVPGGAELDRPRPVVLLTDTTTATDPRAVSRRR